MKNDNFSLRFRELQADLQVNMHSSRTNKLQQSILNKFPHAFKRKYFLVFLNIHWYEANSNLHDRSLGFDGTSNGK